MEAKIDAMMLKMDKLDSLQAGINNLEASFANLATSLTRDVQNLSERVDSHQQVINSLERRLRQRNIVIFGMEEDESDVISQVVKLFVSTLKIPCSATDIESASRIGKKSADHPRLVLVEFGSLKKKNEVFAKRSELTGGLRLRNDISPWARARWAAESGSSTGPNASKNSKRPRSTNSSGDSPNSQLSMSKKPVNLKTPPKI
ncbi:Hypothetical protein NTJ_11387 [Nesidiocoris tenuis]|uniref:Uncharacterized protein n=2 Tax=Nesidiocoris tenuis TaxID=355587 RepID=A0ABN7B2C2_9HEMI|nr:Hypothetical protein NTJ_11387 [Nesidiocoris tenuis]